jgi:hypothetical protein
VGDGDESVSEQPFVASGAGVRVVLPSQVRGVLSRSFGLVERLITEGREEAWRVAPPLYDDPLLEAEAALAREGGKSGAEQRAAADVLGEWSSKIVTIGELDTEGVDALARALNLSRLVLAEMRQSGVDQGLIDLFGWLLESLLASAPEPRAGTS